MKWFILIGFALIIIAFMAYEMYTAPLAEETKDGGFRIIKEGKKLSDLFKKKSKTK